MDGGAGVGEEYVEHRAHQTALWGSCVKDEGGGSVVTNPDLLWSVCEEVHDS